MSVKPGDRVMITKLGHPAEGQAGVMLGWGDIDGAAILFVAGRTPHYDKIWPVYVLRPWHVDLVASGNQEDGEKLVKDIIDAVEARGCPLRGIYDWAGPYISKVQHEA